MRRLAGEPTTPVLVFVAFDLVMNVHCQPADFYQAVAQISRTFIDLPAPIVDDKVEEAIAQVAQLIGADRATVTQVSSDGKSGDRTHQWCRPESAPVPGDDPVSSFPWVTERVVRERGAVVVSRLDELPPNATRDRQSLQAFSIKSLAVYPVAVGGSAIGALSFAVLTREQEWPAVVRDGLRLVSEIVGSALARKFAHLQLQDALAFERLIAELSATFIDLPPEGFDDHVHRLLARVADVLDLDRSNVFQRGLDDGRLHVTHQWVREGFRPVPPLVLEQEVPWLVSRLLGGNDVIFSSPDELPSEASHERERNERYGPKSMALLPMTVGGVVVGGIAFGCLRRPRQWDADTIGRLRLVTDIVGSALARKRADLELRAALEATERLRKRLEAENVYLQTEVKSVGDYEEVVGRSPAIRAVLHKVDQVAPADVPVLLLGETGTGKELIARAIHAGSARSARALIAVNCAALPPSLIESELFGHEKGAFTGAMHARPGRFELADCGTLFLDEIGDLEPALQGKLLRALQGGEIERLGSSRPHKVDVRVIAATNRDLGAAMDAGRFRADLYYRLSVFPIEVPALRERRDDIPLLVWHFIQSRQRKLGRFVKDIPKPAMDALVAYDWPGNVRELQNVIDRALILTTGSTLRIEETLGVGPAALRPRVRADVDVEDLAAAERAHIVRVLESCDWAIQGHGRAAERLGLRPSTLRNRMRKLGIRRPTEC
jgi:formate hydrogenlyase transcriptional activator